MRLDQDNLHPKLHSAAALVSCFNFCTLVVLLCKISPPLPLCSPFLPMLRAYQGRSLKRWQHLCQLSFDQWRININFCCAIIYKKPLPNLIKEIHGACRTEVTKFLRFSTHSATLFPDFRSLQGPFPPQNSSELIVELIFVVSHSEYDNHCKGIPIETRWCLSWQSELK